MVTLAERERGCPASTRTSGRLSDDDLTALGEAATRVGVAGARYNEAMQRMTGL
ncbi:hypothetical protein [Spirilliplanes yamanashiensis]|uniref:Uncharacterized protein n=1 Tax=Spirilliplanes yamanashiensis TaxID=42233 RepID=A0A8J3YEJ0_9ACTN|nr:hypothetical protein [Spirilliplanes yamanashiensis]MDP9816711.1 hypothetical protein [Spirilliplanes yamanashiensis]GIJ06233.1 hypothetical protein Sya03_55850 [Spirilliplanes yamanashiensis]